MSWVVLGLTTGFIIYAVFLISLTFSDKFSRWFYLFMLEDTLLGEAGKILYYPSEGDRERAEDKVSRIIFILILISLHSLIFLVWTIISMLVGAIIFPFLVLGIFIGPIVYYFVNRKKNKLPVN